MENVSDKIVIYQTEDGQTAIDVRLEQETVWLSQAQMAELFQTDRTSIVRHINNILSRENLREREPVQKLHKFKEKEEGRLLVPYRTLI